MKTMYTCNSGFSLIEMGADFGAWNEALVEIGEYMLEVEEAAITRENHEGEYIGYIVNTKLGAVKVIKQVTAEDIEKIMVDSRSI